jgi:gas vesicle protein
MRTQRQEVQHPGEHTSRAKPVLSGLLLGGLIGAGTALLFAPQSGEKTRTEIQNRTIEFRDRTTDTVKDAVSQVKSRTRQMASDVLEQARDLTQHGKDALAGQLHEVSQITSRQKPIQGP